MSIAINLIWVYQIIFIDLKYTSYAKEQAERRIIKIRQINCIIAHFLFCYDIKVKRKIKYCHCKYIKSIKKTVKLEVEGDAGSQFFLINKVSSNIIYFTHLLAFYNL